MFEVDDHYGPYYSADNLDCIIGMYTGRNANLIDQVRDDIEGSRFGHTYDVVADVTGDGVSDIFAGNRVHPSTQANQNTHVFRIDGGTFEIIDELANLRGHPDLSSDEVLSVGDSALRTLGDVNKNGSEDVMIRLCLDALSGDECGILVVDGFTLEPLYEYSDPQANVDFANLMLPAGDIDDDGFPDMALFTRSDYAFYTSRPQGVSVIGDGHPALDGRLPEIGTDSLVEVSRQQLGINTSNVELGREALLLLSRERRTTTLTNGARVLVPGQILRTHAAQDGPFVNAKIDLPLPQDPRCLGETVYVQWVIPEQGPAGGLHFAASRLLELTLLP
ncbi:MAG: hypothetical protein WD226_05235 [Planctomycetota bacterium]